MNPVNMFRMAVILCVYAGVLMIAPAIAADIRVVGLFDNRVLLEIDGKQRLLRVGQTSPEGVKLIKSDSKQAVIEQGGKPTAVALSQHIASSYSRSKVTEVSLTRGSHGHYFGHGAINGYPVEFMVDTGASAIAMNLEQAKRLGVKLDRKKRGTASTAGGMVDTYRVVFDKVSVGGITHYNIRGAVIDGLYPENILLGNSFLSKVEMSEQNGVMMLRDR